MIICEVNKNHLNVRTRELLTAGSQNVNTVEFRFNEAWDGLAKTATFKTSKKIISVLLNTNNTAIPWEALADAGEILAVGVFGVSGETIVLPTVWGILGTVRDAAYLGDEEKEPTPDVYQKILDELNALERPTWDSVQNKPFSTLGGGLEVDKNGVLSAEGGSGGSANAVQYVAQSLTDEQKAQARENIGAKAATEKSAYIISKTRSYGYIHTNGMDFDGVYAQIQSGKVVMLLVDDSSTYYGVIHPASGTGAGKEIVFYNIADISDSGGRNKGIEYFGFTWRKGDDSLTEWWGDIPSVKVDETLAESGSAADAKAVGNVLGTKLDKNQGAGNAGKILGVGEDGNVVPQDKPSITVDSALSSTSENPVQNKVVTAALAEKITAPTTAAVGQIIKVKSVDESGKPTEWEAADLPGGGDNETNFRLVFNQECLLDADMSVYEVDIDFGLQNFKEFIALIEYSASTNNVYQDVMAFDGVTINEYGGNTFKGAKLWRVIYAKRTTQTEYVGIHRAASLAFDWSGGNVPSTLSYFSGRIKTPTSKFKIWRTNAVEATTITVKLYKR